MTLIAKNLDQKKQVDVAYFDFQKAFDRVDSDILLKKLCMAGFSIDLLQFVASYLSNRQQFVQYENSRSAQFLVRSGIGQGSNLGPLLFLVLINDLPAVVTCSTCLLFADDLKLAIPIDTPHNSIQFQSDIDSVHVWAQKNSLTLNEDKCSVMSYTRAREPITHLKYTLNAKSLKYVNEVKDLGTWFDARLTFNPHIAKLCNEARKCLGFVIRQAKLFTNQHAISVLYNAYVRSKLETNSAIWNPHEHQYTLQLEKVQKSFVRFLYHKMYGRYPYLYPTLFVLGMVDYTSLEFRRHMYLVKYFLKLIRGLTINPELLALVPLRVPRTSGMQLRARQRGLLAVPPARTRALSSSPLHLALTLINNILNSDSSLDVFFTPESKLLVASSHYLEILVTKSSITF